MKDNMDTLLKQSLAPVKPDEQVNQMLKANMEARAASGKAGTVMKFRKKKAFVLSAVICAAIATAAMAYSGVVSYITGYSTNGEFTSFSELEQAEDKAGLNIRAAEQFENGYAFDQMDIVHQTQHDEAGNALAQYDGIHIVYQKDGEPDIYLDTDPANAVTEDERAAVETKIVSGIELRYYNDTYKFVPEGYEQTAEDEENLKRDDYFISEGSDAVEITTVSTVVWTQDGISYSLQCSGGCPSETLFDMAEELISQP